MVPFGPEVGDEEVIPGMLTSGQTIDLHMFFPFYGGLYNYTTVAFVFTAAISVNGYIGFATVLDQGPTINIGPDATDWPKHQDPAMIAPYLCKQQIPQDMNPGMRSGVFFRLMMRQSLFGRGSGGNMNLGGSYQSSFFGQSASTACQGTSGGYVRCDQNSDYFIDEMMRWLQASAISGRSDMDAGQLSTYQLVWLTDQAVFNGGNHTGIVPVDPTQAYKNTPKVGNVLALPERHNLLYYLFYFLHYFTFTSCCLNVLARRFLEGIISAFVSKVIPNVANSIAPVTVVT
ncbi:unnamed protein product [Heligmosomoides polygyrus]|uniref:NIDO domain-containing protein n=1 Tax=Heligmosomoides polygyrus TaxID=6339 RepID=A0A3P7TEI5_HELPZ|nr:unnamed protein product [Heligmosomoides polygyrus]